VTYNFDPDRWYENERQAIDAQYRNGKMNAGEYRDAIDDLDCRYDEMLERLDGTYRIPAKKADDPG